MSMSNLYSIWTYYKDKIFNDQADKPLLLLALLLLLPWTWIHLTCLICSHSAIKKTLESWQNKSNIQGPSWKHTSSPTHTISLALILHRRATRQLLNQYPFGHFPITTTWWRTEAPCSRSSVSQRCVSCSTGYCTSSARSSLSRPTTSRLGSPDPNPNPRP